MKTINFKNLNNYDLIKTEYLSDVKSEGSFLIHKKSGARIVILNNDEENKVFSIAFRTPPADSTGVPHIMEHSVLCGSRDFPVKDPFVELVKGSLNTFLNAMTYPDKTVYPVASCNDKDFRNLMHVYLDAVFYPNIYIHDEIFRQEGWSYSMEDKDSPLTINGVVYNEMKGVFSSPDDIVMREVFNSLYPDTCYAVESGGDPDVIPSLTYESFLDFHKKYYHPSNSFIYLYGNIDYEEVLNWIDEAYLSNFEKIIVDSQIEHQRSFDSIKDITIKYPVSDSEPVENNAFLTWNMVCADSLDNKTMQAMEILDYSLLSAPGAPLEKALLEAGIGTDISGSFETDCLQPFISVISKNADEKDKDRFVEVIRNTLQKIADEGMDKKALLAGLNYNEFRVREADFGRLPKGLAYGLMMLNTWIYDETDPFSSLNMLDNYTWLREQVDTGYFEELIRKYMLDNTHGSIITAVPVRGLAAQKEKDLEAKLEKIKAGFSVDQIDEIIRKTAELTEYQEAPEEEENLKKIPILARADLKKEVVPFSINKIDTASITSNSLSDFEFVFHDYDTNGISYLQFLFEIKDIPFELLPYVSILQNVLGVIDTTNYTYGDLFNEINLSTGGIGTNIDLFAVNNEISDYRAFFNFKGKALSANTPVLFDMIREIICESKLDDTDRIKEILLQSISQLQAKFMSAGHSVAVARANACQGGMALVKEYTSGIAFYNILKTLADRFDEIKNDLSALLITLSSKIFTRNNLIFSHTGSAEDNDKLQKLLTDWNIENRNDSEIAEEDTNISKNKKEPVRSICDNVSGISEYIEFAGKILWEGNVIEPARKEAFYSASQVQFVARCGNFKKHGFKYNGAMHALRTILGYEYLWEKVRVTGGAYGCMSSFTRLGDCFFVSYRDPHLTRTNEVFESIPDYLAKFDADEHTMTKYIIGACSDIDQPMSPETLGIRSLAAYIMNLSEECIQKERDELLTAEPQNIRDLADLIKAVMDEGLICTVGGEEKIRSAEKLFDYINPLI